MTRVRLDKLLLERGLAETLDTARALIMAGQVVVGNHMIDKAGRMVTAEDDVRLKSGQHQYVSRGGIKLQKALNEFCVDVAGLVAVDVGASTGGFTDCLLQAGAAKVFAIDVGYGQLAWKLRQDPRVVIMERTNIRHVTREQFDEEPELAVIDASFISLGKVLPVVAGLLPRGGRIIALIKPQFEVGRHEAVAGGVIHDSAIHDKVIDDIRRTSFDMGLSVVGLCESPITGADGNREFLILLQVPVTPGERGQDGGVHFL